MIRTVDPQIVELAILLDRYIEAQDTINDTFKDNFLNAIENIQSPTVHISLIQYINYIRKIAKLSIGTEHQVEIMKIVDDFYINRCKPHR